MYSINLERLKQKYPPPEDLSEFTLKLHSDRWEILKEDKIDHSILESYEKHAMTLASIAWYEKQTCNLGYSVKDSDKALQNAMKDENPWNVVKNALRILEEMKSAKSV